MPLFKAVVLDWSGTLVVPIWGPSGAGRPKGGEWIARALTRMGRDASAAEVGRISAAMVAAEQLPAVAGALARGDLSERDFATAFALWTAAAEIDDALVEALRAVNVDPAGGQFAEDAARTLAALKAAGMRVAVLSDIHFDLRPWFAHAGLDQYVDHFVLSFEHGVRKPDPAIFRIALDALGVAPADALMVGDRAGYDGAAVDVGLPTLLLPPLTAVTESRLHLVLAACDVTAG
ncbi:MAG TPA: HAD-IA family hydrolase [Trebonia sp.]|nr:HAD-IA family hydrolase [Trebonia sp.]